MKLYQISVLFIGLVVFFANAQEQDIAMSMSKEAVQPLSLRMLKQVDFMSAVDAVYTHAVANNELEKLPEGFIRVWQQVKAGSEVVEMRDFIDSFPVLYEQLLVHRMLFADLVHESADVASETEDFSELQSDMNRSGFDPEAQIQALSDRLTALEARIDKNDSELLEVLWEFGARLMELEQKVGQYTQPLPTSQEQ